MNDNLLSYGKILKDQLEFKKSGTSHGVDFNRYDFKSHKYFKILFYFGDDSPNSNEFGIRSNGLLHPTWKLFNESSSSTDYYSYNSAWSYLKLNDENERADKLEKFVTLLSNINRYSPWYFTSIAGVDAALERKVVEAEKFDIGEAKRLTINCLPDAFDNRIQSLLELYRDVTWSWIHKKSILPVNLRKFDMAIYIFESPIRFWNDNSTLNGTDNFQPSYKMIEFHDCEFSYNSLKSGFNEINNTEGFNSNFSIEIMYNDCYEVSYNDKLMRELGDFISTDIYQAVINEEGTNVSSVPFESSIDDILERAKIQQTELETRESAAANNKEHRFSGSKDIYSYGNLRMRDTSTYNATLHKDADHTTIVKESSMTGERGFLSNVIGQGVGLITDHVKEKLTRAVLGNLYTYSLTKIGSQLGELAKGNLIKSGQSVKQYIDNAQQRAAAKVKNTNGSIGNIFKDSIANN